MPESGTPPWSREEFEARLRAKQHRYHIHHPYHLALNGGGCTKPQLQGWVLNRFYYQISIPLKDAAILANMPDRAERRRWIRRIIDQDGADEASGGIEAWLRLAEATGLRRDEVTSLAHVLPGVRFAVDAYVNFARRAPWQEAVCSSLTELFAPDIHRLRLDSWPAHYPWVEPTGYAYFRRRLSEARRDVEHGLAVTLEHFRTAGEQHRALEILDFKLDVLWAVLDAIQLAYGIGEDRTRGAHVAGKR